MHTATRRTLLSAKKDEFYVPEWVTYLSSLGRGVQCAQEFRGVTSLEDSVQIGNIPSIVSSPVGGLEFSKDGLLCDEDTVLDTGYLPSLTCTVAILFTNTDLSPVRSAMVFGAEGGTYAYDVVYCQPWGTFTSSTDRRFAWRSSTSYSGTYTSAWMGITPNVAWVNGWKQTINAYTKQATTDNMYVGARNNNGSVSDEYRGTIRAFFMTTGTLTDAEMGNMYTKMAAG